MKKYILALLLCWTAALMAQQREGAGTFTIKELNTNTENSDFGCAFYGDKKLVFASPKKGVSLVNDVWLDNNQRYLELYQAEILPNGDLLNPELLKGDVNTRYHEADVVFTKDMKTVYFTRNNYYNKTLARDSNEMANLALFKATVNDQGEWVNIIPMPFNNVEYSVGPPALSDDEQTLYFISDMPGGFGQTDIYKVDIGYGGYSDPVNLGPILNSEYKDFSPFIDGDVIYFSSDRPGGMGGLDVYASRLVEYPPEPILLNEPINSTADDFTFIINGTSRRGYLSTNRIGGEGDDDLYSFIEEEPVRFKCAQLIAGEVRDENTAEVIQGAIVSIKDADGKVVEQVEVGEDGTFKLPVFCETDYVIEGTKEGYTPQSKSITTSSEADKKIELLILLGTGEITEIAAATEDKPEGMPEEIPEEIVKVRPSTYVVNIDPIYFELNSSYLNKEAKIELNKVVELMNRYPEMIIESGSHTDSRGIPHYNDWLSTRRAASTVNYIVDRGIDPSRISGKGYGETQLINECYDGVKCTEAQHAMNRRTEFVIVKM